MRDIKFRVFNKASQIIYYPECSRDEFNHYLQIGTGGFWLYNKEGALICTSVRGDILMQTTPRKDKKGRQIWEGDIVDSGKGEIFWDERFCQFRVRWHDMTFKQIRGVSYEYRGGEMLFWNSEIAWEVIGNVHNNSELVNQPTGGALNMQDPNVKAEEGAEVAPAEQATEQESAEEGTTEG